MRQFISKPLTAKAGVLLTTFGRFIFSPWTIDKRIAYLKKSGKNNTKLNELEQLKQTIDEG